MKKIVKIILIAVPVIIISVIFIIVSAHRKTINIDEDLLKMDCRSDTYYDNAYNEKFSKPIKKGSPLSCSLVIHSPKDTKFTYNDISFDYEIIGDYIYQEKPSLSSDVLLIDDKKVHVLYTKEHTLNKEVKYETVYMPVYSFKIVIPDREDIGNELIFKLSNIKIENKKNIYLLNDYQISYEIEKD